MSIEEEEVRTFWLSCDVTGCIGRSEQAYSIGRALNVAVGVDGWQTFGPGRHVCPRRDPPHELAARLWAEESRERRGP